MPTIIVTHEVDDVEHWLTSTRRTEVFGPLGITVRVFADPTNANRVCLLGEIPDMDAFQAFMATDAAADAMKYDGVRPETLITYLEG